VTDESPAEQKKLRVELQILGQPFRHELTGVDGPVRPVRLLPLFQAITNAIVQRSASVAVQSGKQISCRAGCGACCRQVVPISETEARHLAAVVEAMPAARRTAVRARFADARRQLEGAGLWDRLVGHASLTDEEGERLALDVFQAGVPCPFLEDEACSIHPDRPLSCREFLVSSPAENCTDPKPETIEPIPIPSHASDALARIDPNSSSRRVFWMPLIFALDWAAAHPDDQHPPRLALDHLNTFLGYLIALADDASPAPARRGTRKKKKRR
jgi:Fe-S-cluster containining protein